LVLRSDLNEVTDSATRIPSGKGERATEAQTVAQTEAQTEAQTVAQTHLFFCLSVDVISFCSVYHTQTSLGIYHPGLLMAARV